MPLSFGTPDWLWMLAAVPLLLLLEWRAARKAERAVQRLVGGRTPHALLEQRIPGHRRAGMALRTLGLVALVLGAADPHWGQELVRRSALGSEVVLLVDVSSSMDTRDVPPSRLEEARRQMLAVLGRLEGSRVGVVAFAGTAVRLCPLTLDRGAVRLVVEGLSTGSVSDPGSDLGRGLQMAARLLPEGRRSEQAIVLWTDGEDLEGGASRAAEALGGTGVRVLAVGVGTPGGDVVPVLDEDGLAVDVKRDEGGAAVRSRLDESLLRGIARRTGGGYFSASRAGGELPRLLAALGGLGRSGRGERLVSRPVSQFPWFAAIAALAIALELIRRKRRGQDQRRNNAEPVARIAAAWLAWTLVAAPAQAQSEWAKGDRAYRKGRWFEAESLYARRARGNAPAAVRVNRATARALRGETAPAEEELRSLTAAPGTAGQTASYNLGTLLGERGDDEKALESLRRALERDPQDGDARFNYEWILERRRRPPQDSGQNRSPNPSPPPSPSPSPAQQNPGNRGQQIQPQNSPPPPSSDRRNAGLDRQQAEQLLASLQELERQAQQRSRRVRVLREKRGKDW